MPETKQDVFEALLKEWRNLEETAIEEFSGSHRESDLAAVPESVKRWQDRYRDANGSNTATS
jgi:hypothetical protein